MKGNKGEKGRNRFMWDQRERGRKEKECWKEGWMKGREQREEEGRCALCSHCPPAPHLHLPQAWHQGWALQGWSEPPFPLAPSMLCIPPWHAAGFPPTVLLNLGALPFWCAVHKLDLQPNSHTNLALKGFLPFPSKWCWTVGPSELRMVLHVQKGPMHTVASVFIEGRPCWDVSVTISPKEADNMGCRFK